MKIFMDTEFTGLRQDTSLISIGLYDEDEHYFYAEFSDYNPEQLDGWLMTNVFNNLIYRDENNTFTACNRCKDVSMKGTKEQIKKYLTCWLESHKENIQIISDVSHYDFVLFISIFGDTAFDLPQYISPVCHDINHDIANFLMINDREAFDINRIQLASTHKDYPVDRQNTHNALDDALAIKYIYDLINR